MTPDNIYNTPSSADGELLPPASLSSSTSTHTTPETGTTSKVESAKDEAYEVKSQVEESAQNVVETAKAATANVADEVKNNTMDLLHQARTDFTAQAGTQQQNAAKGLHSISNELHTMANASEHSGIASEVIRQVADRSSSVASWLESREPGDVLNELKSFARQRPGAFLLAAAGAGILAGRLGRNLQSASADTPHAPSKPAHLSTPADPIANQETRTMPTSGSQFFDEPVLTGTPGPVSTETLPSGTGSNTALHDDLLSSHPQEGQR